MYSAHFISETISKDVCAQLARQVVNLVPQVVDYTCCVCEYPSPSKAPLYPPRIISLPLWSVLIPCLGLSLGWLPIRLDCSHIFCIRCMIKMQNQNKRYCPLCRADVIQAANESKSLLHLARCPRLYTDVRPQATSMRSSCDTWRCGSPRRPRRNRRTMRLNAAGNCWETSTWTSIPTPDAS